MRAPELSEDDKKIMEGIAREFDLYLSLNFFYITSKKEKGEYVEQFANAHDMYCFLRGLEFSNKIRKFEE